MPGKGREDAKLGARATDLADSGCGRSVIWIACRVRLRPRPIAEQPHRASGDGPAAFARAEQDPGPHNHNVRQGSDTEEAPKQGERKRGEPGTSAPVDGENRGRVNTDKTKIKSN